MSSSIIGQSQKEVVDLLNLSNMVFVAPLLNGTKYNEEGYAFKEQSEVC